MSGNRPDVALRPMTSDEIAAFVIRSRSTFVEERVRLGRSRATFVHEHARLGRSRACADAQATSTLDRSLPDHRPAPGHHIFHVTVDGSPCGHLWIGRTGSEDDGG